MVPMPLKRLRLPLVVFALVAAACSSGATSTGSAGAGIGVPADNAAEAALLPTDAQRLPDFSFNDYQALLAQLRGTPVLVNIWGSWCGPCRDEAPDLARLHETYGHKVQFIGVDILDARESARAFMDEFGWTYPSVYDASGDIRNRLAYVGQPDTILYDADGKIAADWQGPIDPQEVERAIKKVLGEANE